MLLAMLNIMEWILKKSHNNTTMNKSTVLLVILLLPHILFAADQCVHLFPVTKSLNQVSTNTDGDTIGLFQRIKNKFKLFSKSQQEVEFLEAEKARDLMSDRNSIKINQAFELYAAKNNIKYEKIADSYLILADFAASELNQFVASVQEKISANKQSINFIFDPKSENRGSYQFSTKTIRISLESVFLGQPTLTEIHEYIHMLNHIRFLQGEVSLLTAGLSPYEGPTISFKKYKYAKFCSIDELETFGINLKLLILNVNRNEKISRTVRMQYLKDIRFSLQIINENLEMYLETINNHIEPSLLKYPGELLKYDFDRDDNGHEIARANFRGVNRLELLWNQPEHIQLVKDQWLAYSSDSPQALTARKEINLKLGAVFFNEIQILKQLLFQLNASVMLINQKSTDDKYLLGNEFKKDIDQYRRIIADAKKSYARNK